MKKTIIAFSVSVLLSACGGGGEFTPETPQAKVAAEPIVMDYTQAQVLRSADGRLPEGYARYIVKINPAANIDTSSVIMQQQAIDEITTPEFAAKVLKVFDDTSMSSYSATTTTMLPNSSAFVMEVPLESQAGLLQKLSSNPAIAEIIPDQVVSLNQTNQEPSFNFDTSLLNIDPSYWWHLDRVDQKTLPLNKSYVNNSVASNVNVYVVDSGVTPHNELKTLKPGFGAINDGYGTKDCFGHGTGVASHIGGQNVGISGTPSIYPVRVMGCAGTGVMSDMAKGFEWVLANAKRPAVINMSLGGAATSFIDDYVKKMIDRGFTVVVAAGNDNKDACSYSPARVPAGITVGATNVADTKSSFSNFGSCVSIFAPGENIVTAHKSAPNAYALASGTSFASPLTAGVAALVLQKRPDWSPANVKSQLISQSSKSVVKNSMSATSNLLYALPGTMQALPNATMGYVHSLAGAKSVATGGWKQTVSITLKSSTGTALSNTQAIGYFSNSATPVSCVTNTSGVCSVVSGLTTAASLTFKLDTLRQTNVIYRTDLNKQLSVVTNK